MRLTTILFALIFGLGANVAPATAAEVNYWRTPGLHPLSTSVDGRDAVALDCVARLPAPKGAAEKLAAKLAVGYHGTTIQLTDGTRFKAMTYAGCKIWPNVEVQSASDNSIAEQK